MIIYSNLPLTTYLKYLKQKIFQQKTFSYQLWISENFKQCHKQEYYGIISDTTFNLVKIIYEKNLFTPIICGKLVNECAYTKIELFIKNSPYTRLAYICIFIICSIHGILLLVTHEITCVFSIIAAVMIFLAFFLLGLV